MEHSRKEIIESFKMNGGLIMSEFISGNAGIIKKEDIVFLEILEPNPFFLKDEYKIYATTYTLDKGERKVLLESRKKV